MRRAGFCPRSLRPLFPFQFTEDNRGQHCHSAKNLKRFVDAVYKLRRIRLKARREKEDREQRGCRDVKALIQYEEVTGTLLDRHHIALSDAINGDVQGLPDIHGTHKP
jgi:hypothetical protein